MMILEGIEGVAGRGPMKEDGVLGGSIFGINFFHDSLNAESVPVAEAAAGTSDEKDRMLRVAAEPENRREACLNMV